MALHSSGGLWDDGFADGKQDVYQRLACVEDPTRNGVCIFCAAEVLMDERHEMACVWKLARQACGYVVLEWPDTKGQRKETA